MLALFTTQRLRCPLWNDLEKQKLLTFENIQQRTLTLTMVGGGGLNRKFNRLQTNKNERLTN